MELPCTVCQAPLKDYEYVQHLKACVKIKVAFAPKVPPTQQTLNELAAECWRIHNEEQAQTHLRTATGGNVAVPPPPSDPHDKLRNWYGQQRRDGLGHQPGTPPPGKTARCAVCNGMSHMYPSCVPCDGTGWV